MKIIISTMHKSRSRSLPASSRINRPSENHMLQKPALHRQRSVASTPNPAKRISSVQPADDDTRPFTTFPRISKDSRLSTVAEFSHPTVRLDSAVEFPHAERVMSAATILWRKKQLHDVILAIGHHRVGAHKLILAACSDYFRDLFTQQESSDDTTESFVYTLHGISYETLKIMLESMYTSQLEVTYRNIRELLNAAIYLRVPVAFQSCTEFLLLNLCVDTSLQTLSVAVAFSLPEITEQAIQICARHFLSVALSPDFLQLEIEALKILLQRDDLRVDSELHVFQAAQRWIEADIEERLGPHCYEVLENVRLPMIKPTDLVDHVESVDYFMNIPECEELVKEALHYYCLPLRQSVMQSPRTMPRSTTKLTTIVALGGQPRRAKESVSKDIRYFNEGTNTWVLLTKMPQARHHHAVAVLGGFLYIAGGRETTSPLIRPLNTAYRYDPRTDTWLQIADMITGRESFQMGVLHETLYAVGGRVDDKTSLASVEQYDPYQDKWEEVASLEEPRRCVSVAAYGELIYAMGGSGGGKILCKVECFNPDINSWQRKQPLSKPRIFGHLCPVGDFLYLAGGATVDSSGSLQCVRGIERYHPPSDEWVTLSKMLYPRAEAACSVVNDKIFMVGGYSWDSKSWLQSVECYDIDEDEWNESKEFPKAFTGMACCTMTLHRVT